MQFLAKKEKLPQKLHDGDRKTIHAEVSMERLISAIVDNPGYVLEMFKKNYGKDIQSAVQFYQAVQTQLLNETVQWKKPLYEDFIDSLNVKVAKVVVDDFREGGLRSIDEYRAHLAKLPLPILKKVTKLFSAYDSFESQFMAHQHPHEPPAAPRKQISFEKLVTEAIEQARTKNELPGGPGAQV